jgi:hypothetical protein
MTDDDIEKRLSKLNLARASDTYLDKGVEHVQAGTPAVRFWQRSLPVVLTSALVLSVTANIFQLVNNRQQINALEADQLVQCNTPAAAASTVTGQEMEFATFGNELQPQGMC